jgi:creatinine amidohydrolase
LNHKWSGTTLVAHIQEYYDYASVAKFMEGHGIKETKPENMHDDPIITLNMFIDDPNSVRYDARVKAGKATINGVSIADRNKSLEWARAIVEARATRTAELIRKAIASRPKS